MRIFIILSLLLTNFSFAQSLDWHSIPPQTDASFRGLSIVDDTIAWVSGSKGWVGRSTNGGKGWSFQQVKDYEKCDFRSLYAFDRNNAVIANAGSPSYILRTQDGGLSWTKVYEDKDSLAFFDGIDFWNKRHGIIYGDPKDGHLEILRTNDGGQTWVELPQSSRPALTEGEASFAASGTTIRCLGNSRVLIATGGKVSRLLVSKNRGKKWKARNTPILQGQSTQGIFSIACSGSKKIIIAGGDYKQDTLKTANVFYSDNGGRQWKAPVHPTGGYRECVTFLDDSNVVAIGPSGTDFSGSAGYSWLPDNEEKQYHTIKMSRKGSCIIAAGGGGKIAVAAHIRMVEVSVADK